MSLTMAEIQSKIRGNVIRLRREKTHTQEDLAHILNCSQSFINQLESGEKEFNVEHIYKIASALNCSIYQILPDDKLEMGEIDAR